MSLTKLDKNWIQKTINETIVKAFTDFYDVIRQNFASKEELQKVENRLDKKFDTVIDKLDSILGNLNEDRDDINLMSARVSDHEDRLQVLESK